LVLEHDYGLKNRCYSEPLWRNSDLTSSTARRSSARARHSRVPPSLSSRLRRAFARSHHASSLLAMRTLAQILLARCFWRSRIWLRSRLASWAAVSGLGTACARAGAGSPAGVRLSAKGWTGGAPCGCAPCAARATVVPSGYHRLAASAAQSPFPPTTNHGEP